MITFVFVIKKQVKTQDLIFFINSLSLGKVNSFKSIIKTPAA